MNLFWAWSRNPPKTIADTVYVSIYTYPLDIVPSTNHNLYCHWQSELKEEKKTHTIITNKMSLKSINNNFLSLHSFRNQSYYEKKKYSSFSSFVITPNKCYVQGPINILIKTERKMVFEIEKHFVQTRWAILGPTPGSKSSSWIELGMSPSYFMRQMSATFFK